ncbi:SoxR reducing system RseC family protein [Criibacterium bergeronii]|nr:SoxR reducing system RseC family protein [Criibacterium bergeronii]MBS6064134.1 SoxR reducing system RseC family protein [Peptostreptococcaceae bacterium]
MKELATVIQTNDQDALVRVLRSDACGKCKACSMWSEKSEYIDLTVKNTLDAKIGDSVELDLDSPDVLAASFVMYVIPLIALIGGVMLGYYVIKPNDELTAVITGFILLALSYIGLKFNDNRLKNSDRFVIKMTGKATPLL